jgi:hypothetical protein
MSTVQGVTFEKDRAGISRYIRIDMRQHAKALRPFMQSLGLTPSPDGWDEGLTSEEFLMAAKQMLRKKFDGRGKVS